MKNVGNSSRGRIQGVPKIFRAPTYRAHCAVIFAIAHLSCDFYCYCMWENFELKTVSTASHWLSVFSLTQKFKGPFVSDHLKKFLNGAAGCEIRQSLLLITNRKSNTRFDWYQNQWPWLTLKWPSMAMMHSVALHICFSEPTTEIWMKIDPYNQQQKRSSGILVSSKIIFMQIFAGVRWRGASNESGIVDNYDFCFICSLYLLNLHI